LINGMTCAVLNRVGNVAWSKDRFASLAMMCANVPLQALITDVGTKSNGDDLADIEPMRRSTSMSVTGAKCDRHDPRCAWSNASGSWLKEASADDMHNLMLSTLLLKNDANVEQKAVTSSVDLLSVSLE
jgi:hypothetical protein